MENQIQKPAFLKVICFAFVVLYGLFLLFSILDIFDEIGSAPSRYDLSSLEHARKVLETLGFVIAGIALSKLKKWGLYLFTILSSITIFSSAMYLVQRGPGAFVSVLFPGISSGLITLIIIAIHLVPLMYLWNQRKLFN